MPRPQMDLELDTIKQDVEEMTMMVHRDILNAVKAIKERDHAMATEIMEHGDKIDDLEDRINEECFTFLATQAPIATDLRYTISVMKMIRDLERIGDHCEDLAKYAMRLDGKESDDELVKIPRMAELAARMVEDATDSFLHMDLRLARRVWKSDEEVDDLFHLVQEEQMELATKSEHPETCISYAFIAAHLERIADYATNICEETIFAVENVLL